MVFVCAAASRPHEADGMGVIDHDHRIVFVGQAANVRQIGEVTVHAENTIGGDQPSTGTARLTQAPLEVIHIVVLVTKAICFAEPNAINNAGVIE